MPAGPQPDGSDLGRVLAEARRLCPEVQAAVLTGPDGLVLERYAPPGQVGAPDPELMAAESSGSLARLLSFAATVGLGQTQEWTLHGDDAAVVGRAIPGTDLWLLILASKVAWHGRLRFAARVTAGRLAPILAAGSG
jgi:predicted regulator of Ras-like GTPase activity (Roadblock/LC7/MglB family)